MSRVFITGANRGIGLALAKTYLANGDEVHATYRDTQQSKELLDLKLHNHLLFCHKLDVTDYFAVAKLAQQFASLDIVISNAGYYGPKGYPLGQTDEMEWRRTLEVNAIAPLKLAEAFMPLVKQGNDKKMAFISSKMGSMTDNQSGGAYIYRSSKAALNSVVKSLSIDLEPSGITVLAIHPGWVKTSMGGPNAQMNPNTSAYQIYNFIHNATMKRTGQFVNFDGAHIPW
ncbi:SDR family NAD(P)-dependent oxidoreductase [Vibrio sp. CAIM 722]|uniref:SDR family NAD(P)-dependent oxidoreductase n=1 Tax=Vibrio eleionomae TaxID=2653505 RepID=A0A7X4LHR1_9VIBR|nr:SDR family oxidoreductase [Vibrio eleionomae]MZI92144.1 SDR family NAD(P)-dependent oxidoreductase [Vibrio eleionomae]